MAQAASLESFRVIYAKDGRCVVPFWGGSSPFSNHYKTAAGQFSVDNGLFDCVERYYMLMKALLFGDQQVAERMRAQLTMAQLKRLGRQVKGFKKGLWDAVGPVVMLIAAHAKYTQNHALGQLLMNTGDSIMVEASPYDTLWGAGVNSFDPLLKEPPESWPGENRLGVVLMVLREYMRFRQAGGKGGKIKAELIPSKNRELVKDLVEAVEYLDHRMSYDRTFVAQDYLAEFLKNAEELSY